jgi:hypothetical protein
MKVSHSAVSQVGNRSAGSRTMEPLMARSPVQSRTRNPLQAWLRNGYKSVSVNATQPNPESQKPQAMPGVSLRGGGGI